MELWPYIQDIHHQLALAAEAGGEETRALAERLAAPLDAAIRLALQDVLAAAAEEITCELAPGSVEVRLRGRDPELVVTPPPIDAAAGDLSEGGDDKVPTGWPATTGIGPLATAETDEGGMSRINLRMPDQLKALVEQAAGSERLSVNAWLVRAASAALERADPERRREPRTPLSNQRYTGWAH